MFVICPFPKLHAPSSSGSQIIGIKTEDLSKMLECPPCCCFIFNRKLLQIKLHAIRKLFYRTKS